jgi:small subunit ribosomal protein S4
MHAISLDKAVPSWLQLDKDSLSGRVVNLPRREEIDTQVTEQLVVEYYSR